MNNAMRWLQENLPQWPESELNLMNVPLDDWVWFVDKAWINGCYCESFFLVNVTSGEFISDDEFYAERDKQRLTPCGMSFKELIEDLSL
jgi:hypothetical protein